MKKILLGLAVLTSLTSLNAQVEIQVDGTGSNVAGTSVNVPVEANGTAHGVHLYITNNTGADQNWYITRVRTNVPSGWLEPGNFSEQLCWPPQCYFANSVGPYQTPAYCTILNGTNTAVSSGGSTSIADLNPKVIPNPSVIGSSASFTYYVTNTSGGYVDSVTVIYDAVADVEEAPVLSLNVAPNPADNYIKIKATGSNEATVKIVDVLGNVVMKETFIEASKTVDVTEFKNGIYFIRVEAPGAQTINRKVIVRH